jgi:hypothetical protein
VTQIAGPICVIPFCSVSSPLCIPDFLEAELKSGDAIQEINLRLQEKNWLTTGIIAEISSLFPTAVDVNPSTGERDEAKFVENCQPLFPLGRIFASHKQLDQVAKMFLEAWAISKAHNGKKISCHLGPQLKKRKKPSLDAPREHPTTLKQQTSQLSL